MNALQRVHDTGFIHRDVKPQNIVLRNNDTPILIDFGSARRALTSKTQSLNAIVNPGYAPFEQYDSRGSHQGPWTDIYSLAGVAYRAISGKTPSDTVARMAAVMPGEPDPVSAESEGEGRYATRILRAIDDGLRVRPSERPQSIAEWRERLKPTFTSGNLANPPPKPVVVKPGSQPRDESDQSSQTRSPGGEPLAATESAPEQQTPAARPRRRTRLRRWLRLKAPASGSGYLFHVAMSKVVIPIAVITLSMYLIGLFFSLPDVHKKLEP